MAGLKGKKIGIGGKILRVLEIVWCGEIMCGNGFQEVRGGAFFLGARLID